MSDRFVELSELDRALWQRPGFAEAWERISPPFVLGDNVNRLRRERALTQEQLAERAGMRQPRIAAIERGDGNPRLDTLTRLAIALEVPVWTLLREEVDEARESATDFRASE